MYNVQLYARVRRACMVEGMSLGASDTLAKSVQILCNGIRLRGSWQVQTAGSGGDATC